MDPRSLASMFGGIFGNMFGGNAGDPYRDAGREYENWYNKGKQFQNPFYEAGVGAIPQFQEWLGGMKNPSDFINNLMGNYQESPWAHYQQEQAVRGAQNMGSASGLSGSTPLAQFAAQNARDISSQDMNQWLQHVLGINTQYGAGLGGQMGMGQNAGNVLSQMSSDYGKQIAENEYNKRASEQNQRNSLWGGIFNF